MTGYREGHRSIEVVRFEHRPWWASVIVGFLASIHALSWGSVWLLLPALIVVAAFWARRPRVVLELDHDRETLRVQRVGRGRGGFELPFGSITSVACISLGRENALVVRDQDEKAHVLVQGMPTEEDAERLRELLAPVRGPR